MKEVKVRMVSRVLQCMVFAGLVEIAPGIASASTYTWGGGSSGDWTTASNWDSGSYPNSTSADAVIDNGGTVTIQCTTGPGYGLTCKSVVLSNGSSLVNYGTTSNYYELTINSITAGTGGGTFYMNGGWLGGSSLTIDTDVVLSGRNSLIRAGHSNTVTINGDFSGTGRLNTLSKNGSLLFNGSITPGTDGTVGNIEISYNYDIGHANPCQKEFGDDIMLNFDLGDTSNYDQIIIIGNGTSLTIHDLDWSNFTINELDGFGAGTYTLIDDVDLNMTDTTVDTIVGSLGSDLVRTVGGYNETLSLVNNDIVLTVTAVPEPATLGLLFLGLLSIVRKKSE